MRIASSIAVLVAISTYGCSGENHAGLREFSVEVRNECLARIPSDYSLVRESADELSYFSDQNGTGFVTIKFGDFRHKIAKFDQLSKEFTMSKNYGDRILLYRVNEKGSRPIGDAAFFASEFAILVVGKDAAKVEHITGNCIPT